MNLRRQACASVLLAGLCAPVLINCAALSKAGNGAALGCPAMDDGKLDSLKLDLSPKVKADIKGFLEAVYAMSIHAVRMEKSLIDSCAELGKGIHMDETALEAEPSGGDGAKTVCGAVGERIRALVAKAGSVGVKITVGKPHCEVPVGAMIDCYKGCGESIDPAHIEASCEAGKIAGKCEGNCTGGCILDAGASCDGNCRGLCDGVCDGKQASGICPGKCEGSCSGGCEVAGKAKCDGLCAGGCSVAWKLPVCTGTFKPPSIARRCLLGCASKMAGEVKCTPPPVDVVIEGEASAKAKTDLADLVGSLKTTLPKIAALSLGVLARLVKNAEALIDFGKGLPDIAKQAGPPAIACIHTATGIAGSVRAALQISVDASLGIAESTAATAKGGGK